jgi:putative hydrolase of the HAD superfamily
MPYSVVLFDVGQTLLGSAEPFGETYSRVYRELGIDLPGDVLHRVLFEVMAEQDARWPAGTDRYAVYPGGEEEYWLRFSMATVERAGGPTPGPNLAKAAMERLREIFASPDAWKIFDDVVPALDGLREAGVRMGVVSNWDSRLPAVLEMLSLDGYFEALGVSHLEGVEKPDPELFHRVLRKMDAEPADALHVGDIPEMDRDGARAAGIDWVLIDRAGRLDGTPGVIRDLGRLTEIVANGLPGA